MEYSTTTKRHFSITLSERDLTNAIIEFVGRRLRNDILEKHNEMLLSYRRDDAIPKFTISGGNQGMCPLVLMAEFEIVLEDDEGVGEHY